MFVCLCVLESLPHAAKAQLPIQLFQRIYFKFRNFHEQSFTKRKPSRYGELSLQFTESCKPWQCCKM